MEQKEIANSTIRSLFAAIPFAGQPLNELFFDYRSRVKQNRLNEFSHLLSSYFETHSPVEFKDLNRVEFSDLFESVILRVAHTGSIEKHKRFRDILVGYIQNPSYSMEHSDTFLELVSVLKEQSIQILKYHAIYEAEFDRLDQLDQTLSGQIRKADSEIEKEKACLNHSNENFNTTVEKKEQFIKELKTIQEEQKNLSKYKQAAFYGLDNADFLYLKQILASRALMTDAAIGAIGHIQFNHMRITTFGKKFIDYLRDDQF